MKAVVWRGDERVTIESVEDACIEAPTDINQRVMRALRRQKEPVVK